MVIVIFPQISTNVKGKRGFVLKYVRTPRVVIIALVSMDMYWRRKVTAVLQV